MPWKDVLPLVGIVLGSVITYLATTKAEKRRHQREDVLDERRLKREHLKDVLHRQSAALTTYVNMCSDASVLGGPRPSAAEAKEFHQRTLSLWPELSGAFNSEDFASQAVVMLDATANARGGDPADHQQAVRVVSGFIDRMRGAVRASQDALGLEQPKPLEPIMPHDKWNAMMKRGHLKSVFRLYGMTPEEREKYEAEVDEQIPMPKGGGSS